MDREKQVVCSHCGEYVDESFSVHHHSKLWQINHHLCALCEASFEVPIRNRGEWKCHNTKDDYALCEPYYRMKQEAKLAAAMIMLPMYFVTTEHEVFYAVTKEAYDPIGGNHYENVADGFETYEEAKRHADKLNSQ